mgnify:FL=1|jgi:phage shock protein A
MKLKNVLERIAELTSAERDTQLEQYKQLKKLLKELRKKHIELEEKISSTDDKMKKKELEAKLKIIDTQHYKGPELLKELKNSKKTC